MIAAVLFDLDNTLLNHSRAERLAALDFRGAFPDAFGGEPEEAFVARWRELTERFYPRYLAGELPYAEHRRERMRALFADPGLAAGEADRRFARYLERYEARWEAFPDVEPCWRRLAGLALGVVTNGDEAQQRRKLERLGLLDRCRAVVTSGGFGTPKPDPRIFRAACDLAGEPPERCAFVGDHAEADAAGASAAGLRGIWLNRDGRDAPDGVRESIPGLAALPELLAGPGDAG